MLKSMTGFGSGECVMFEKAFKVEIKAVNHRYCDIFLKMPYVLNMFDARIRKIITEKLARGKLDVYIGFTDKAENSASVSVNQPLVKAYCEALHEIAANNDLKDDFSAAFLSKFPDVLNVTPVIEDEEQVFQPLQNALLSALDALIEMRTSEGESLKTDLLKKREHILELVDDIEARSPQVVIEYKEKLENRIEELLNGKTLVDENRLATEISFFADKCAVDEEITRLRSHMDQFEEFLNVDGAIGRKLDFLVQEMNREANTIGSKANDKAMTNVVLELKSEIEKIREQVQNIE